MVNHRLRKTLLISGRNRPFLCFGTRKGSANRCSHTRVETPIYSCGIDAEPLHRYRTGGYHPVALGDRLNDGRYKVLHKLGWGSYSTTWAARDYKENKNVAIKVSVSEVSPERELHILQKMSTLSTEHIGRSYLNKKLDDFTLDGPNGSHSCLVLELAGPSVVDFVESYCKDDRLPARLAKPFARQVLQGLDLLARHDIAHGDLHTRNLALALPGWDSLEEMALLNMLEKPDIMPVIREDGKSRADSVPAHLVRSARFRKLNQLLTSPSVKIIDFGESFCNDKPPRTLHTPLPVRAPEVVFEDVLDKRVDLWGAGCMIFELVTGQVPFDTIMLTPPILVQQMLQFDPDGLPDRWRAKWQEVRKDTVQHDHSSTLQEWLDEVYFDDMRAAEFTRQDMATLGRVLAGMLKIEPSRRATPNEALSGEWFRER